MFKVLAPKSGSWGRGHNNGSESNVTNNYGFGILEGRLWLVTQGLTSRFKQSQFM